MNFYLRFDHKEVVTYVKKHKSICLPITLLACRCHSSFRSVNTKTPHYLMRIEPVQSEYNAFIAGAFHDRSTTPDTLISPILMRFGGRGYLACQKHWSQSYYGFQTVCKCPFWALLVTLVTDSNQTWAN